MPRRNNTPKHVPYADTRPDCSHKRKYRSQHEAIAARELRMLENPGLMLDVYQCDHCKQWHLTSVK